MLRPTSLLFALLISGFTSCDFSHDELYEEPITSALLVLTPDSGRTVVLQYLDRDGESGQPAIISGGSLAPNTTYHCEVHLNTIGKHIVDSTSIAQLPEYHQVFFLTQNGLEVSTRYTDTDANGFPVGLKSTLTSDEISRGQLTIIIKHHPNKNAEGVAHGDVSNSGGKTDFEASFEVAVVV